MDGPAAVFDCNVYLQALINPTGPAGQCVAAVLDGRVWLVTSRTATAELRDVAGRPEIQEKFPHLTAERVETFIASVEAAAAVVARAVPGHFTYTRDPDDAHYVDLSVDAGAAWLVTSDKDLLALMT